MARYSKAQIAESLAHLRRLCPPGTTVHTKLTHVSRSGMRREIAPIVFRRGKVDDGLYIWWHVAVVLGLAANGRSPGTVKVDGAGMDMGYHLVMNLSYALHGHEDHGADAIKHSQAGRPFKPRRGHFRAGYSLNHRWI